MNERGVEFDGVGNRSQQGVGRQPFALVLEFAGHETESKNVTKSMVWGLTHKIRHSEHDCMRNEVVGHQ